MIRRMFWLVLGAALGVSGYRKVTALARSLRPAPQGGGLAEFAADVREGMALYMERQARPPTSTLEGHRRAALPGDGQRAGLPRGRQRAGLPRGGHGGSAHNHDEPKDGR